MQNWDTDIESRVTEGFRYCHGKGNFHHVSLGGKSPVTSSSRWGKTAHRLGIEGNSQNYGRSCTLGWDLAFDVSATCVNCKGPTVLVLAFLFVLRFTYTAFVWNTEVGPGLSYISVVPKWFIEALISNTKLFQWRNICQVPWKFRYFYAVLDHVYFAQTTLPLFKWVLLF